LEKKIKKKKKKKEADRIQELSIQEQMVKRRKYIVLIQITSSGGKVSRQRGTNLGGDGIFLIPRLGR